MADIAVTGNQVAPLYPIRAAIRTFVAANTITAGQSVYQTAVGKVDLASSAGASTRQFLGIALNGGGAGQAIDVLMEGECGGFTLSTIAYDGFVYLSDNPGNFADAAGTTLVAVGRVVAKSDSTQTKTVYINRRWDVLW